MNGINAKNVSKSFGEKAVLRDLSFFIKDGTLTLLVGPSGVGKTTLLRMLSGLEAADTGEITGLEGKKIAYLFQEDRLFPWLTAIENVYAVSDEKDKKERALSLLSELGLSDDAKKFPHELSGGMNRRVAIARTLMFGGDVIILDEPFQGLDAESEKNALRVIKKHCNGKTVIAVTHDTEQFEGWDHNVIAIE